MNNELTFGMTAEELLGQLRKSAGARLAEYQVTGDWMTRGINARINLDDVANEAYLELVTLSDRMEAWVSALSIADQMPTHWHYVSAEARHELGLSSLEELIELDEATGHGVGLFALIKWASGQALRALGCRRDMANPSEESLEHLANGWAEGGVLPALLSDSSPLEADEVERALVRAERRLSVSQVATLRAVVETYRTSDHDEDRLARAEARRAGEQALKNSGYSRDGSRDALKRIAGEALAEIETQREMLHR